MAADFQARTNPTAHWGQREARPGRVDVKRLEKKKVLLRDLCHSLTKRLSLALLRKTTCRSNNRVASNISFERHSSLFGIIN